MSPWYENIPSIHVFRPEDDVTNAAYQLYQKTATDQFGPARHALLLTRGSYAAHSQIPVGYYTSVLGVGNQPDDVTVDSFYALDNPDVGNACDNFWRSAEGLHATNPSITWATSQAAPLRRVHVDGELWLSEGLTPHWSSGGFMSSSKVDGLLHFGTQQQYLVRNAELAQGADGKNMNYVFVGVYNAPSNSTDGRISTIEATPRVAEKPYLVERAGAWSICVPQFVYGAVGLANSTACERSVPMADVYVARAGDTAATINAGLATKRALLLTPGLYELDAPIVLQADDFVVLGLGFATLLATSGLPALVVAGTGVRLGGVLLEAATAADAPPTEPLLVWKGDGGVGSDLFTRVASLAYSTPAKPSCALTRADTHIQVNGKDVVLDNLWMWHADHDDCGGASDRSFSAHGLVVNGDNVLAYGVKAEHTFKELMVWAGERGRVYFFQSELPYHDPTFAGVGYLVKPDVKEHSAVGIGVYIVGDLVQATGMVFPPTAHASNLFTWVIGHNHSQFHSVVCTEGAETGAERVCYKGDVCDFSSCYQLALPPPAAII